MPQIIVQRDGVFHSDRVFAGIEYILIGRAPTSDILLPDPAHRVSRYHAAIVRAPGTGERYFIRDLGSLRSTRVFGRSISQYLLREGDVIEIAEYELIYSAREHPKSDTSPLRVVPRRVAKGAVEVSTVALSGVCHTLTLSEPEKEVVESVIQAGREGMKPSDIFAQMMSPIAAATGSKRGFACFFRGSGETGLEVIGRVGMKVADQIEITDSDYLAHLRNSRPVLDDRTVLAPILAGEVPLGFVCLEKDSSSDAFTSEEAEFLTMLGHLATARSRATSLNPVRLRPENVVLDWPCEMVGNSEPMRRMRTEITEAAASDINVLVLGENGTGKELVARAIHAAGPPKRGPFLAKNCAAITETLAETEIFGYARRSGIAGAEPDGAPGWFEQASGGTLLLDEIQGLTITLQDKFLRVLQDKQVWRVRARTGIPIQIKIIAATDQDLTQAIEAGTFRKPFYFRFGKIIRIPPLRERKEDIPLLAFYFLDKYASSISSPVRTISYRAMQKLQAYSWPGNVRELENSIRSAIAKASDREFLFSWDFPDLIETAQSRDEGTNQSGALPTQVAIPPRPKSMSEVEKDKIIEALEATRGNISQAARLLGYRSRQTMLNKMDRHSISRDYGDPASTLEG